MYNEIWKKGKLSPRYMGPYEVLKRVGKIAYKLKLPSELDPVYPVFYISLINRWIGDTVSIKQVTITGKSS